MAQEPRIEYEYQRVADDIERKIKAGEIPLGGKLGGELELGEVYGVAGGTVRRAVRELRERGLVKTLPAKGTFVIARPPQDASPETASDEPGTE